MHAAAQGKVAEGELPQDRDGISQMAAGDDSARQRVDLTGQGVRQRLPQQAELAKFVCQAASPAIAAGIHEGTQIIEVGRPFTLAAAMAAGIGGRRCRQRFFQARALRLVACRPGKLIMYDPGEPQEIAQLFAAVAQRIHRLE